MRLVSADNEIRLDVPFSRQAAVVHVDEQRANAGDLAGLVAAFVDDGEYAAAHPLTALYFGPALPDRAVSRTRFVIVLAAVVEKTEPNRRIGRARKQPDMLGAHFRVYTRNAPPVFRA